MKTCSRCNKPRPLTDYHKRKAAKDGYCYYCKHCAEKSRVRKKQTRPTNLSPKNEEYFEEEYRFFRSQGISHQRIAHIMGYSDSRLQQLVMQLDCRIMEPGEQKCWDTILKCVDRRMPFCVHDMPFDVEGEDYNMAISLAVRRGLVVKAGKAESHVLSGSKGRPATLYEAV